MGYIAAGGVEGSTHDTLHPTELLKRHKDLCGGRHGEQPEDDSSRYPFSRAPYQVHTTRSDYYSQGHTITAGWAMEKHGGHDWDNLRLMAKNFQLSRI